MSVLCEISVTCTGYTVVEADTAAPNHNGVRNLTDLAMESCKEVKFKSFHSDITLIHENNVTYVLKQFFRLPIK